ncbi:MAG: methyltransferase domain-containing protein [Anaerolineae bacterium]
MNDIESRRTAEAGNSGDGGDHPRICDYEGTDYRTRFWENKGRDYEDRVERIALRQLLPRQGGSRFLEIGAGFGRLTNELSAFQQVVLLDYSYSQMADAQSRLGRSDRYVYVAADMYKMPFKPGVFDGVSVIRVLHHIADVPLALHEVRRVMAPNSTFILEYASKRNLKAIVRWLLKRQSWSPFALEPVEFVELNFDFHPEYIHRELNAAGFSTAKRLPVSYFRMGALKRLIPVGILAGLDRLMQATGLLYSPSVFTRNLTNGDTPDQRRLAEIFACPECGGDLVLEGETVVCHHDHLRWAIRDGIYDFKAPIE